jgi:GTP-binding protein
MGIPIVAIVGRPNVGKSTLFNRLLGRQLAIVEDLPGTTRDRLYADTEWRQVPLTLVDTGGLQPRGESDLMSLVRFQVEEAVREADAIILLVDVTSGIAPPDYEIAELLRRSSKPVVLAVNKADNPRRRGEAALFYELGLGEPIPISAYHGLGISDLMEQVLPHLPATPEPQVPKEVVRLAIVGRPNVGKSSLLNALLGQERAIVSETPGTTRDAIDTHLTWQGQDFLLIDTAGLRRRGRVGTGAEYYGTIRALRAIQRADLAVLILDAGEGIAAQDIHIAGYLHEARKGAIAVVNKWDLIPKGERREAAVSWERCLRERFRFMAYLPFLFVSARFGTGVKRVLPLALRIAAERRRRVPTGALNQAVQRIVAAHQPPSKGRRQLKVLYATQADTAPPTFVFFVNDKDLVHFSYHRYLENRLRETFGFAMTPLKLVFKNRNEEG